MSTKKELEEQNILLIGALRKCSEAFKSLKCPDCHVGVFRPKCLFELGGDCPRHEIANPFQCAEYATRTALNTVKDPTK